MKLDLEKAFVYIFKDPSWTNKLIAGAGIVTIMYLFSLLPVFVYIVSMSIPLMTISLFLSFVVIFFLNCAVSGFVAETANKRINYRNSILPDWSKFGRLSLSGLKYFIGYFLYSVPVLILVVLFLVLFVFYLGQGLGIAGFNNTFVFMLMVLLGAIFLFSMVLYSIFFPLMMVSFYKDLKIISFVDFKSAFTLLKNNHSNYFVVILLFIAFNILFQIICSFLVVTILGAVLIPFLYFYMYLVVAEVLAQFILVARED